MTSSISSIGILYSSTRNLQNQQATLASLSEQLSTHKKHTNLTDYDPTQASQLLNFQSTVTQKQAYISAIDTVQSRLTFYDTALTDMESITSSAASLATDNQTYDSTKLASIQTRAKTYLKQLTDDLNLKSGDRYLFSGIRYSSAPVADLSTFTTAPSPTTVSSPTLPDYDNAFVTSGTTTDANAYTQDSVTIDTGYSITYGITSNDQSIQKIIAGLRSIVQATNETTSAAYQTDMISASNLLRSGLTALQGVHTQLASNQNALTSAKDTLNTQITTLTNQVSDIQEADLTEVSTTINLLQTQLSASYSATASLEQLSILKYL